MTSQKQLHCWWHHRNNFSSDDITETTSPVVTSLKPLHCWWHHRINLTSNDITETTSLSATSQKELHQRWHHGKNVTSDDITEKTSPVMTSWKKLHQWLHHRNCVTVGGCHTQAKPSQKLPRRPKPPAVGDCKILWAPSEKQIDADDAAWTQGGLLRGSYRFLGRQNELYKVYVPVA